MFLTFQEHKETSGKTAP